MVMHKFKNKFNNFSLKVLSNPTAKKFVFGLYFAAIFLIIYHFFYAHRIIPGIKIGSVRVGGQTYEQAKKTLEENLVKTVTKLPLEYENKRYEIAGQSINLQYNWDAAISRAFEIGRTGNLLADTKDKIAGLFKDLYISAFYDYDEDLFHARFSQIKGEINQEAKEADIVINQSGALEVAEASQGRKVIEDDLFKIIINAFDRVSFTTREIPVEKHSPNVYAIEITPILSEVKKIVGNKLTVTNDKKQWILDQKQMVDLLAFTKESGKIEATLNRPKFEAFLESIAQETNKSPRGAVTQIEGNKVIRFEITQAGTEIDKKQFTQNFKKAFLGGDKEVALVFKNMDLPSDVNKFGIFALLGEGSSNFTGSSNARIHNLTLAAQRTSGVLVPPGGIYSMNNAVGDISGQTGYDAAYIIKNGRTVLGEGGGVCQTSTTLFRAVLNAGLPIVMRYPHAYRVKYYEYDSKPGIDASIFQPSLDLQFRNDTPNYVLIQSSADLNALTLNFKIYGTPDGRLVEMSEPVVTNQTPPPAPLYIDDPNLAKGAIVQVDYPAWGANVSFTRVVRRGGEKLFEDTFNSRYQAWRAIFMRGTKEN